MIEYVISTAAIGMTFLAILIMIMAFEIVILLRDGFDAMNILMLSVTGMCILVLISTPETGVQFINITTVKP